MMDEDIKSVSETPDEVNIQGMDTEEIEEIEEIEETQKPYVFKKLDEDTGDLGISFKKIGDDEAYKPVDRMAPAKEKLAHTSEKIKENTDKSLEKFKGFKEDITEKIQGLDPKQKKLISFSAIGSVALIIILVISIGIYKNSDAYAYNLANKYIKAENYDAATDIYKRLISEKDDLKSKEILAFLYLDVLHNPNLAEPLLKEIRNETKDQNILARLVDIFPVITMSPDSSNQTIYKELIEVELSTTATGARILYKLENNDSYEDFKSYSQPIQLSDGINTIYVKSISSYGMESDAITYRYTVDLDDKFVVFDNYNLEYDIKKTFDKENEKLKQSDIDKIESLEISGGYFFINNSFTDITEYNRQDSLVYNNLEDLSKLRNLKQLRIVGNGLEDFLKSSLNLSSLESLEICYSQLTDITFLKSVPNLYHLDLSNNEINSINGVQTLNMLKTLNLGNNKIGDAYHISNLVNLTSLDIRNNPIQDTMVLKSLTKLENLAFTSTSSTDYGFMENMKNLKHLDAGNYNGSKQYFGSEGRDISAISNLSELETLSLQGAGIRDASSLSNLKNIVKLNISFNDLYQEDIDIIGTLKNIENLSIESTNGSLDIGPLAQLNKIKYINLSNNYGIKNIESLKTLESLNILSASRIGLRSFEGLNKLGNIEYLDISYNGLAEIDLSGYASLIYFDGTSNQLSSYPKLSTKANPDIIILKHNPIEDISNLESTIGNISYLDIAGTKIKDLSIFSKASKLNVLILPNIHQLINLSVFDDMQSIKLVPINTSEKDLPSDLLNQHKIKFIMK